MQTVLMVLARLVGVAAWQRTRSFCLGWQG